MAVCFFWGLARVPMAQAVALTFIAPLLSLYLSSILLGERVARRTIGASFVALFASSVAVAFATSFDRRSAAAAFGW